MESWSYTTWGAAGCVWCVTRVTTAQAIKPTPVACCVYSSCPCSFSFSSWEGWILMWQHKFSKSKTRFMALAAADVLRLSIHPSICLAISLSLSLSLSLCLFVFSILPYCSVRLAGWLCVSETLKFCGQLGVREIYCIYKHITNAPRSRSLPQGCATPRSAARHTAIPSSRIKARFTSCQIEADAAAPQASLCPVLSPSLSRSASCFLSTSWRTPRPVARLMVRWIALRAASNLQLTIWITHCSFLAAIYCHCCCCCCCHFLLQPSALEFLNGNVASSFFLWHQHILSIFTWKYTKDATSMPRGTFKAAAITTNAATACCCKHGWHH